MSNLSVWHWILIVLLLTIPANGIIANHKGRSVAGWVILGLMFNPIALVVLLFLPSRAIDVGH